MGLANAIHSTALSESIDSVLDYRSHEPLAKLSATREMEAGCYSGFHVFGFVLHPLLASQKAMYASIERL